MFNLSLQHAFNFRVRYRNMASGCEVNRALFLLGFWMTQQLLLRHLRLKVAWAKLDHTSELLLMPCMNKYKSGSCPCEQFYSLLSRLQHGNQAWAGRKDVKVISKINVPSTVCCVSAPMVLHNIFLDLYDWPQTLKNPEDACISYFFEFLWLELAVAVFASCFLDLLLIDLLCRFMPVYLKISCLGLVPALLVAYLWCWRRWNLWDLCSSPY